MKKKMRMSENTQYGVGLIVWVFGCAGMAEAITGQGSFMVATIIFSIGLALIIDSYVRKN